jgi:hypothetical protein
VSAEELEWASDDSNSYFENVAANAVPADTQRSLEGDPTPEGDMEEEGGVGMWLLGCVLLVAGVYLWKRKLA